MSDLNVYYVPWNFGDWLSQTSMLSPLDYALYHRLLMQCYLKGGAIKDSDIEMAIRWVCGNDLETIERSSGVHRSVVEAYFERGEDGLWHNARCSKELELMRSKKLQSQAAVRAREEKRAAKRSNIENGSGDHRTINGRSAENDQTISESIENGSDDDRAINGRSTDSEQPIILIKNKELITNTSPKGEGESADAPRRTRTRAPKREINFYGLPEDLIADWKEHRKAKDAPLTQTAVNGFKNQADRIKWPLERAVRWSILNGSAGFNADWESVKRACREGNASAADDEKMKALHQLLMEYDRYCAPYVAKTMRPPMDFDQWKQSVYPDNPNPQDAQMSIEEQFALEGGR